MYIILLKLLVSVGTALISGLLVYQRTRIQRLLVPVSTSRFVLLAWLALRIVPFTLLFVVFGVEPRSDTEYYFNVVEPAFRGGFVYRDFHNPYGPFFPYFVGAIFWFWHGKKALVLFMVLMEGLALWGTTRFFADDRDPVRVRFNALLYLLLPGSVMYGLVCGQDDVWLWLFALTGVVVYEKTRNEALTALVLMVGFLLSKAVFVLWMIPVFFAVRRKWLYAVAGGVAGVVVIGALYATTGLKFYTQPRYESEIVRAPNLLATLNPLTFDHLGLGRSFWNWVGLLVTTGFGCWLLWQAQARQNTRQAYALAFVAIYATMMVIQQSAYANYLFIFLLPLVFVLPEVDGGRRVGWLLLFNLACAMHPSLWWRQNQPLHTAPGAIFANVGYAVEYVVGATVVGCTLYCIGRAVRLLRALPVRLPNPNVPARTVR